MKKKLTEWSAKKPLYIKKDDERYEKYQSQLKTWGFSDTETWSLRDVIAEFTLPRLKRFKEVTNGHPCEITMEEWYEIIDKMIFAFEWMKIDDEMPPEWDAMTNEEKDEAWKKHEEGMKLFGEYFMHLWW